MDNPLVQAGDFVIFDEDAYENVHAIRSIQQNGIIIYPLDNQRNEKRLFQINGHACDENPFSSPKARAALPWVLAGENVSHTLKFVRYIPLPSLVYGVGPDITEESQDMPNIEPYYDFSDHHYFRNLTVQQLDQAYKDLSAYGVTPEQFVNDFQIKMSGYVDEFPPHSFSKNQVEWMLKENLFPPTYELNHMIHLYDLNLIRRIDRVSRANDRDIYAVIMESYMDMILDDLEDAARRQFLLNLFEYLAGNGRIPSMNDLNLMIVSNNEDVSLLEFLQIWIDKNVITNYQRFIDMALKEDKPEIVELLTSSFQPTKSARKR